MVVCFDEATNYGLPESWLSLTEQTPQTSRIQVRMRANPPPQSGVQCLGQARTLRFICFYSVIEPAERESRRAHRGKPARPCFRTHGKTTPRCSILGGPIGIQICSQILLVFYPCHPGWLPFRFILVPFLVHVGGLWAPFCSSLKAFGVHWASLEGPLEEGCFFIDFWKPKLSQSGAPEAPKIHSKWVQNSIVF